MNINSSQSQGETLKRICWHNNEIKWIEINLTYLSFLFLNIINHITYKDCKLYYLERYNFLNIVSFVFEVYHSNHIMSATAFDLNLTIIKKEKEKWNVSFMTAAVVQCTYFFKIKTK